MKQIRMGLNGERSTLVMIGACLLVIACIVGLIVIDQKADQ